ncbi:MAG: hypothetical protein Q4E70_00380 [Candidatus Saccharibacteria bacterium]|nr:hypothetical protein [Candidatus Saccharibacteria bacterium]
MHKNNPKKAVLLSLPTNLRQSLLEEFDGVLTAFTRSDWEKVGLKSGRFCECVYTVINGYPNSYSDTVEKPRNFTDSCNQLQGNTKIPRTTKTIICNLLVSTYNMRNLRDIGHVQNDIDSNYMDALFLIRACKWMLSELIRIIDGKKPNTANAAIEQLSNTDVPVIWISPNGLKRVLVENASYKEKILALLCSQRSGSMGLKELFISLEYSNLSVFKKKVLLPLHKECLIDYRVGYDNVTITPKGRRSAEKFLMEYI